MSDVDAVEGKPRRGRPAVLVFDETPRSEIVAKLERGEFQARIAGRELSLTTLLDDSRPEAVVLVWKRASSNPFHSPKEIVKASERFSIPLVCVIERAEDFSNLAETMSGADDWLLADRVDAELGFRLSCVLERHSSNTKPRANSSSPIVDSNFFALAVHDLRTPLNVISLSLCMIGQSLPKDDAGLDDDFHYVEENFGHIERMLMQLSDYFRLFEGDVPISALEFSPRREVNDLLASRGNKPGIRFGKIDLVVEPSCPEVVVLDPQKARLAISYALANATSSASSAPIDLVLRGTEERFVAEINIKAPPPSSVKSTTLSPLNYARLCGSPPERRGMDLAIAAKVSEMFGGTARLDVREGRDTTITLEWPLKLAAATVA